jgi:hypothetical protein
MWGLSEFRLPSPYTTAINPGDFRFKLVEAWRSRVRQDTNLVKRSPGLRTSIQGARQVEIGGPEAIEAWRQRY